MFEKIEKYKAELERARAKRTEWDNRVKELERKVREEENLTIQGMVRAANLSPEQLAELIKMTAGQKLDAINSGEKNDMEDDDEEII